MIGAPFLLKTYHNHAFNSRRPILALADVTGRTRSTACFEYGSPAFGGLSNRGVGQEVQEEVRERGIGPIYLLRYGLEQRHPCAHRNVDELPQTTVPFPNDQRETHDLGHLFGDPRRLGARPGAHDSRERYQRPRMLR